jgi:DNA-binding response OmpR family regulator
MPKILIVDDDTDLCAWIAGVLQRFDYEVESLPSGEDVKRLMGLGYIDLALIDYHLPGQSGLSLLRELHAAKSSIPVVILTADGSQQLAVEAFRAGATDFIAKPIDPDYLNIVVKRSLERHSKTLKDAAFRALSYVRHKPECKFYQDNQKCDCGLKTLYEDIQDYS